MRKLMHIGIPTSQKPADANFLDVFKVWVTDSSKSAHQIEWLYFEPESCMAKIVQDKTHVAYQVENIEEAIKGATVVCPIIDLGALKIAFIVEEGIPVELVEVV